MSDSVADTVSPLLFVSETMCMERLRNLFVHISAEGNAKVNQTFG